MTGHTVRLASHWHNEGLCSTAEEHLVFRLDEKDIPPVSTEKTRFPGLQNGRAEGEKQKKQAALLN